MHSSPDLGGASGPSGVSASTGQRAQSVNTGYNYECNLRADKYYYVRPSSGVPADLNCALCTAAGVLTVLSGTVVTTGEIVRRLYPRPELSLPAETYLRDKKLDYALVYQHPETFDRLSRTLTGGDGDLARVDSANAAVANGIVKVITAAGCVYRGGETDVLIDAAKQSMMKPDYGNCVFAVFGVRHWNVARRSSAGVVFVDYQTDHDARQGPSEGRATMQLEGHDMVDVECVTFLAFSLLAGQAEVHAAGVTGDAPGDGEQP